MNWILLISLLVVYGLVQMTWQVMSRLLWAFSCAARVGCLFAISRLLFHPNCQASDCKEVPNSNPIGIEIWHHLAISELLFQTKRQSRDLQSETKEGRAQSNSNDTSQPHTHPQHSRDCPAWFLNQLYVLVALFLMEIPHNFSVFITFLCH